MFQNTEVEMKVHVVGLEDVPLKLLLKPCPDPDGLQLYHDLQCTQALPQLAAVHTGISTYGLQYPAGDKVSFACDQSVCTVL